MLFGRAKPERQLRSDEGVALGVGLRCRVAVAFVVRLWIFMENSLMG